jgi:hypothetical protein
VTDQRVCAAATVKQSCYAVYDDAGNNLNICSLLKFKIYLTDDLRINEINAVCMSPYGPPPQFSRPTTPGDPLTPHGDSSQVHLSYFDCS